jgi:NAD(P)-dependent dehydrogenase (short-subunit alcohol dehydrogenase family)
MTGGAPTFALAGRSGELAGAAVYLASPAAGYVTGITIAVDGAASGSQGHGHAKGA